MEEREIKSVTNNQSSLPQNYSYFFTKINIAMKISLIYNTILNCPFVYNTLLTILPFCNFSHYVFINKKNPI